MKKHRVKLISYAAVEEYRRMVEIDSRKKQSFVVRYNRQFSYLNRIIVPFKARICRSASMSPVGTEPRSHYTLDGYDNSIIILAIDVHEVWKVD